MNLYYLIHFPSLSQDLDELSWERIKMMSHSKINIYRDNKNQQGPNITRTPLPGEKIEIKEKI